MFKYLHGILTTKLRLFNIKQVASPLCERCNLVEDNLHMFSTCTKVKPLVLYFRNIIENVCDIKSCSMKDVLYLQNTTINKLQCNTLVVLTSTFIGTVWYFRNNINDIELANFMIKLLKHFNILLLILKEKMNLWFTEKYCRLPETVAEIHSTSI